MRRRTKILLTAGIAFLAAIILAATALSSLQGMISKRLQKGWILPPLELYTQGIPLRPGRRLSPHLIEQELRQRGLQADRDYVIGSADACARAAGVTPSVEAQRCLWLKSPALVVTWDENDWVRELWTGTPARPAKSFALFPRLITEFYDGQPILQRKTALGEIPLACLQAVTAIEDRDFLEHKGVSATGILRAVVRNLRKGRWAEGGSTITQQLVKNFFLSPRKTLRRKLEEQALAVLLESQLSKDQILEMYLNVIYMGQSGPYQVRGFGSAAPYYFDKPVSRLELPECALLAALINSPGRYNPFDHDANARARRRLVLHKMHDMGMIDDGEMNAADQAPLPRAPAEKRVHAPYYVMSALKEFQSWNIDTEEGARLYTALDPDVQSQITDSVSRWLPQIESRIRKPAKQPLQAAVITVDLANAEIIGLTGGRDYRATQYNRAVDSRRQIGSVIKPFVYWPALHDKDPLTEVLDEPFEWTMSGRTWRPKDFDKQTFGPVPYFFSLAESLNIPAARVGREVGLDAIAEVVRRSGISEDVPLLPSLTLGAFELSPAAVAQGYSTLARLGDGDYLHTVIRAEDASGEPIFERQPATDLRLDPVQTAVLVGMMEQSIELGTARSARAWGLNGAYAGKTGTTSDTKDAWFAGFNGRLLTVVWVGYDDNTKMGLTGASAALPIWIDLMKKLELVYRPADFSWPSGVEWRAVPRDEILRRFPTLKHLPEEVRLPFANWAS